jgi:hypothetical protein
MVVSYAALYDVQCIMPHLHQLLLDWLHGSICRPARAHAS